MMLLSKQRNALLASVAAIFWCVFSATQVEAQTRREIVDRCKSATALVDLGSIGSGTAFCVHDDGLFVTNYHVVASLPDEDPVKLVLFAGTEKERVETGRVVSLDSESDLAIVQITKVEGLTALPLAEPGSAFETMTITTFGYPFGRLLALAADVYPSISVNTARVGALRRVDGDVRALQIDGTLNPGNSGGPVVDDEGRVVGVAVSTIRGANVSFAVPVGVLREFLDKPGLVMDIPEVRFVDRARPLELPVDVVLFKEEAQPDALRLDIFDSPQSKRTIEAERQRDRFRLTFPPTADVQSPQPLLIAVRHGEYTSYDRVSDASISLGSRTLQLAEVRSIESRPELNIVTTVYGEKVAYEFKDWDKIRSDAEPVAELSAADRIDVFAIGDVSPLIAWTLTALRDGKATATRSGVIHLTGFPVHVSPKPAAKFLESLAEYEKEFQHVEQQLSEVKKEFPDSIARIEASRSTPPEWQAPEPVLMQSEGQATFTRQEDGSYFVEGNNPPTDVYDLRYRLPFPLEKLTAVRLEILPDERLPQKAIGRGQYANIVLSEVHISSVTKGKENDVPLPVLRATADFEQFYSNRPEIEWPIENAFDGNPQTGWALWQQMFQPHVAVFELGKVEPPPGESSHRLRIRMSQQYGQSYTIGRFRVTVTDSPRPVVADRLPENIEAVLAVPPAERTDDQRQTLQDYFTRTNIRLHVLERRLSELKFDHPMFPLAAITPMDDPSLLPPEELTIEAAVDGDSDLYVFREGLIWDHLAWKKPGRQNGLGKYVLVNGEEWYPQWQQNSAAIEGPDQSEPYLLPLGPPTWDVEVVAITDLDGRPNPGRGSVKHHYEEGRLKLSFRDPGPEFGLFRVRLRRHNSDR